MAPTDFSSIPTLDYTLLSSGRRDEFVAQLRHALVNVGFLYLAHPPVHRSLVDAVVGYAPRLFELPQEKKDKLRMVNSSHFLGYSRLGAELTKGATDQREQFDFATEFEGTPWTPGEPEYLRLLGESQWPEEEDLPGFKATMQRYLAQVGALSYEFTGLLAEALGLPPSGLSTFLNAPGPGHLQHRAKVVRYPARVPDASPQGVGAHFDAGFLTFLLQASPHAGLQVQNPAGEWVDAPPVPDTLVVNFGRGLETATRGLARATSHRVLSPPVGGPPRYSVPFFQRIAQEITLTEHIPEFPPEILKLKDQQGVNGVTDSVNYSEYGLLPSGQVELIGRVKSHPDVAQRHYPDLFKLYFPDGLPAYGNAY